MTPTAGITPTDIHLFNEGTHRSLYEKLGAHLSGSGTRFAVWAPNAASVSVIGDFNGWDSEANPHIAPRAGEYRGVDPNNLAI